MQEIEMKIGGTEMFIPLNDRLRELVGITYRNLNYKRHIARMRHANIGEVDTPFIVMDADFVFALEDTLDESGYGDVFHRQFESFDLDTRKVLYAIFREDKTIRFLVAVMGVKKETVEEAIRQLFERLNTEVR